MKTTKFLTVIFIMLALTSVSSLWAKGDQVIEKTFAQKDKIKIKLALGDCEIIKSKDDKIHVRVVHSWDKDVFEAVFKEKSSYLLMEEEINNGRHGGDSHWTIKVPTGVEIDFNTGTGDLKIDGIKIEIDGNTGTGDLSILDCTGEFDLNTGTGDIEVMNSKGEFDLNSGTGEVTIKNTEGEFDLNSGTGDVEAKNITIVDEGDFNSGTGDVKVTKPQGDNYDLSINSGTGDAVLDMGGQPIEGYFEFKAHKRRGDIVSPVAFDREEEIEQNDEILLIKSFTKGKKTPRYQISTGTGEAKLVK